MTSFQRWASVGTSPARTCAISAVRRWEAASFQNEGLLPSLVPDRASTSAIAWQSAIRRSPPSVASGSNLISSSGLYRQLARDVGSRTNTGPIVSRSRPDDRHLAFRVVGEHAAPVG